MIREAKEYLEKALGLYPTAQELSSIYVMYGNMTTGEEAESFFKRATDIYPENAIAYYNWGTLLMNKNMLTEAEQKLRLAIELDPYFAEAYHNLVNVLISKRDFSGTEKLSLKTFSKENENFDKEEKLIRKADELKPDTAEILYSLGDVLRLQGRHQAAIEAYKRAIDKNPKINIGAIGPSLYYEELRNW